jgi:hypothetical protein
MRLQVVASLSLALAACGSSGTSSPPASDSGAPVSLRNDVLPILQSSCSVDSTCHGSPNGIEVYLAAPTADAQSMHDHVVGVASVELPSMPYVTAGDPVNSYLMHKIAGDMSTLPGCASTDCGVRMPKGQAPLDEAQLATIRAWITQGAPSN